MNTQDPAVTAASVRTAATLVGLPLETDRAEAVAAILNEWLPSAHALNVRMRMGGRDRIMPITPFPPADAKGTGDA